MKNTLELYTHVYPTVLQQIATDFHKQIVDYNSTEMDKSDRIKVRKFKREIEIILIIYNASFMTNEIIDFLTVIYLDYNDDKLYWEKRYKTLKKEIKDDDILSRS